MPLELLRSDNNNVKLNSVHMRSRRSIASRGRALLAEWIMLLQRPRNKDVIAQNSAVVAAIQTN